MTVYDIIKELGVTKGWSPVYGECPIELNDELSLISITDGVNEMILTRGGKFADNGECVIFPSKENRDWDAELKRKRSQLLPFNTLVMASIDGEYWELRYYKRDRQCSMDKSSKEGPTRKYIVIPSKFMFNADDLSINIKNSI